MSGIEVPTIAILASGSGSTAEATIKATQDGRLEAAVGLVIYNNRSAGVVDRVKQLNDKYGLSIGSAHICSEEGGQREKGGQTEKEAAMIADACKNYDLVALMGYMKKVSGGLLERLTVNTHPGPLPETANTIGREAQVRVLELGLPRTAQTLHHVIANYDEGAIIAQNFVDVLPDDTPDTLFERVQIAEKRYLPLDLNELLKTI